MKPGVAPRVAAADNIRRIVDEGAYSNVLLDQPGTQQGRDRATTQRLTLETLRWLPLIDFRIAAMSERKIESLDANVVNPVRVALTELHLGGDAHGVVDSAVEAVRVLGAGRASGFVNALCRRASSGDVPTPPEPDRTALEQGMPPWIWSRLAAVFGDGRAGELVDALNRPAPLAIRLRRSVPGAAGEPVAGISSARTMPSRRDVTALGDAAVVMDPASTGVALAVEVRPGDRVLDVAAAPGNKTSALWDAMDARGLLVAVDAHPRRTKRAQRRMRKLGVGAAWLTADGVRPPFPPQSFDRVLLDAPCTGLGTLRRRPEIKLRLDPESPRRMGELQRRLLEASLDLVKPTGRVVYSACTFFAEETVDVVAGLGAGPANLPGERYGDGTLLAPDTTGTDGMFVAVIDR